MPYALCPLPLSYPLRAALNADDLALNQDLVEAVTHGRVVGVFRTQFDIVFAQEETFDSGLLVVDERHYDLTVLGVLPGFTNRQIAVQDSGIFHRLAFNTQRK